jgi:hypothetical protein
MILHYVILCIVVICCVMFVMLTYYCGTCRSNSASCNRLYSTVHFVCNVNILLWNLSVQQSQLQYTVQHCTFCVYCSKWQQKILLHNICKLDLHLAAGFIIFICVVSGELSDGWSAVRGVGCSVEWSVG